VVTEKYNIVGNNHKQTVGKKKMSPLSVLVGMGLLVIALFAGDVRAANPSGLEGALPLSSDSQVSHLNARRRVVHERIERLGGYDDEQFNRALALHRRSGHFRNITNPRKEKPHLMQRWCATHEPTARHEHAMAHTLSIPACGVSMCDDPSYTMAYVSIQSAHRLGAISYPLIIPQFFDAADPSELFPLNSDTPFILNKMNGAYGASGLSFTAAMVPFEFDMANKRHIRGSMVVPFCSAGSLSDHSCDSDCNTPETDYDGGDCYAQAKKIARVCDSSLVGNGQCDAVCNTAKNHWDGGDCCPETNSMWETNHADGLEIQCDDSVSGHLTVCTGCINPASPNRQWYGLTKHGFAGEWKALFETCEINGESCFGAGLAMYVAPMPTTTNLLGVGTFPTDPAANTAYGGLLMNAQLTWGANSMFTDAGTTAIHESGHCFGLKHTHSEYSDLAHCSRCIEPNLAPSKTVSSMTLGDFCADTRPTCTNFACRDPKPTDSWYAAPCPNPDHATKWVNTDYKNFMGYSDGQCMNHFSTQQLARVRCHVELFYPNSYNAYDAKTRPNPVIVRPTAMLQNGKIVLKWQPPVAPNDLFAMYSYEIRRMPAFTGATTRTVAAGHALAFTDGQVMHGTSYTYWVRTVRGTMKASIESPSSNAITA